MIKNNKPKEHVDSLKFSETTKKPEKTTPTIDILVRVLVCACAWIFPINPRIETINKIKNRANP